MPIPKHGHATRDANSSTYRAWASMKARCSRATEKCFINYGARGIKVCERWLAFENFLEDMGERPAGFSLERKDNSAGYCKDNCKWATPKEQNLNRRNTRRIMWRGKLTPVVTVAESVGMNHNVLRERLNLGWSIKRATTEPKKFTPASVPVEKTGHCMTPTGRGSSLS